MIDKYFGDRFRNRRTSCDRLNNRLAQSRRCDTSTPDRALYVCIDEFVDDEGNLTPRTEKGFGDYTQIKMYGKQLEQEAKSSDKSPNSSDSPFIMLRYYDKATNSYASAKIFFSGSIEDLTKEFKDYVQRVNCELVNYMREAYPCAGFGGKLTVNGTSDKKVLDILKKRVRAEELVIYG